MRDLFETIYEKAEEHAILIAVSVMFTAIFAGWAYAIACNTGQTI